MYIPSTLCTKNPPQILPNIPRSTVPLGGFSYVFIPWPRFEKIDVEETGVITYKPRGKVPPCCLKQRGFLSTREDMTGQGHNGCITTEFSKGMQGLQCQEAPHCKEASHMSSRALMT